MKRAASILLFAAATAQAHVGPHPEAGIAFDQRLGARVDRSLPFEDAQGGRITFGEALGARPAVLLMGYVRCRDLCGVTLPGVAEALDRSGLDAARDYRAIFASIDAREDPSVLATGLERVPAAQRAAWKFLGTDEASVRALAQAVGFHYRYEPARDAFAHPEGVVVLSPDGRVSRYLFGVRFDPSDLRLALAEASQGREGRLADRLLLLCYHFDPATGRYTTRVLDALRLAIALFAVAAAGLAWAHRRGRKGAVR